MVAVADRGRDLSRGTLTLIAVAAAVALLMSGGIILMIRLLPERAAPPAVVAPPDEDQGVQAVAQRLDEERKKLEQERATFEMEKRRLEFDRQMARGATALGTKRWEEAQEAYRAALRLFPEDDRPLTGLTEAKAAALAMEKASARDKEEREQKQAEVARLRDAAKQALAKKKYAEAVRALEGARQLAHGDQAVTQALGEAQAALEKDAAEKKKLAEYQKHMDAGKAALDAQQFADAVRAFKAAQEVIPGDGDALSGQKAAENKLAAARAQENRVAAHKDLMEKGQAAMEARRFADAVAAFTQAQKLFPADKPTVKALKSARLALAEGRQQYLDLMEQADEALQAQRWEEAHRLYTKALDVVPNDAAAQRGQQSAADILQNIRAGRSAYIRFMLQGQEAMQTFRFLDAVRSFREALRLLPGDPNALRGLRAAEAALAQAGPGGAAQTPPVDLDAALKAGAAALAQRQFTTASRTFAEVLRLAPDNAAARAGLHQAKYGLAMNEGQKALLAGRPQDAIKSFEAALKEMPGDAAATAALRQARALQQ
jgi:tetratricopeptide (TPR) repeat protein